jgi:hypothetical protein
MSTGNKPAGGQVLANLRELSTKPGGIVRNTPLVVVILVAAFATATSFLSELLPGKRISPR